MNKNTFGIVAIVLVLIALSQKKTNSLNQNQSGVTANAGQLTRNPLDGQLYYYFDPTALGNDPNSDSIYGTPTASSSSNDTPWNVAAGDGTNATDPNVIGQSPAGNPIQFTF